MSALAIALFEAYSRNSGNPPHCHRDRIAAEQWMEQALDECGLTELIASDQEFDAAHAAIRENHKPGDVVPLDDPMVVRITEAEARRAAALKGVQP